MVYRISDLDHLTLRYLKLLLDIVNETHNALQNASTHYQLHLLGARTCHRSLLARVVYHLYSSLT